MLRVWIDLASRVGSPNRAGLARCVAERTRVEAQLAPTRERLSRELAACEAQIREARRTVFDRSDGVVPFDMTELERGWRALHRRATETPATKLWESIAPAAWIDRKRHRDEPPGRWGETAVALASDVEGVEAAEAAVLAFRRASARWGLIPSQRIAWRLWSEDEPSLGELLARMLDAIATEYGGAVDPNQDLAARALERTVVEAVTLRFPERSELAHQLGLAARIDELCDATAARTSNPGAALRALAATGYWPLRATPSCTVLGLPPLDG